MNGAYLSRKGISPSRVIDSRIARMQPEGWNPGRWSRRYDIAESKDLDENTILDVDAVGNVCAITFEHASDRTDVNRLKIEGFAA